MALQHLRSNTASKRPTAGAMSDGQIAINTNATSTGLFFKDAGGSIVKVGPVHVGTTAPNSSPAGSTGNSIGEQWLDTSGGGYVLKIWDGSAWRGETVVTTGDTGTVTSTMIADGTIVNADINASAAIAGTKIDPDFGNQTVTIGGLNANLITREQFEETEIKRNAAFSVGTAGAIPFGTGPAIPPGMAFFGIGSDAYNPIHLASGSFC